MNKKLTCTEKISKQGLQREITKLELLIRKTGATLWRIIESPKAKNIEKISAINHLTSNYFLLFEKKISSEWLYEGNIPALPQPAESFEEFELKIKKMIELVEEIRQTKFEIKGNGIV